MLWREGHGEDMEREVVGGGHGIEGWGVAVLTKRREKGGGRGGHTCYGGFSEVQ